MPQDHNQYNSQLALPCCSKTRRRQSSTAIRHRQLWSTLVFPMATVTYCAGQIKGKHIKGRENFIKRC
jgi:hypothetical protein